VMQVDNNQMESRLSAKSNKFICQGGRVSHFGQAQLLSGSTDSLVDPTIRVPQKGFGLNSGLPSFSRFLLRLSLGFGAPTVRQAAPVQVRQDEEQETNAARGREGCT